MIDPTVRKLNAIVASALFLGASVVGVVGVDSGVVPIASAQPLAVNQTFEVQVTGRGGVPAGATAAALQLTATDTSGAGYLTVFPCGSQQPNASVLNFVPSDTQTNLTIVKLDPTGRACVFASASTELIVDVVGWVGSAAPWTPINPTRVTDTRRAPPGTPMIAAGSVIHVPIAAPAEVGDNVTAAALNITATDADGPGFLTVFTCGTTLPRASNVNFQPTVATANLVVATPTSGEICIYTSETTNIIVDVMGWTATSNGVTQMTPRRLTDTRLGEGGPRLGAGTVRSVRIGQPPSTAGVAMLNVTAADGQPGGYLTVYPCNVTQPGTSNVNATSTGAFSGYVLVAPDTNGDVCIYTHHATDLIIDINGWMNSSTGYRPVTPSRLLDTRTIATPPPPGPAPAPAPGPASYPNVSSGVNVASWLVNDGLIPEFSSSEGSFRTFCEISGLGYDDPVIYPGQPGASHLHMYFGNTLINANSTYQSLRSTGSSTCQGGPLNRSGYWIPALHNAVGKVVAPDYFTVYYKGIGSTAMVGNIVTNPNGLRMVAGYNAANPNAIRAEWSCNGGAKSANLPNCGNGGDLRAEVRFPMCWNGRDLDSADHRSHMAYGTGGGGWVTAQGGCPASHPYQLPAFTLIVSFVSDGNSGNWYASSDRMPGMAVQPNGSTFHADWFGAWENSIQETWTQECIREMRSCVWGELGDGMRLQDRAEYAGPGLIDPPAR